MLLRNIFPGFYASTNLVSQKNFVLNNLLDFISISARDGSMVLVRNQSLVSWHDKLYIMHYAKELYLPLTGSKERREEM